MHGIVLRTMYRDDYGLQIEIDSNAQGIDQVPDGTLFHAWIVRSDYMVQDGRTKVVRSYYQICERNELAQAFAKLTTDFREAPASPANLGAYSCCQEVYIGYLQSRFILAQDETAPQWK